MHKLSLLHPSITAWLLLHTGAAELPEHENLTQVVNAQMRDLIGGIIDQNAPMSLCPVEGDAFSGMPALIASNAAGIALMPCFTLQQAHFKNQSLAYLFG